MSFKLSTVLSQDQTSKHISDKKEHIKMKRSEKCFGKVEEVQEVYCRDKQCISVHKPYLSLLSPTLSSVAKHIVGAGEIS